MLSRCSVISPLSSPCLLCPVIPIVIVLVWAAVNHRLTLSSFWSYRPFQVSEAGIISSVGPLPAVAHFVRWSCCIGKYICTAGGSCCSRYFLETSSSAGYNLQMTHLHEQSTLWFYWRSDNFIHLRDFIEDSRCFVITLFLSTSLDSNSIEKLSLAVHGEQVWACYWQ